MRAVPLGGQGGKLWCRKQVPMGEASGSAGSCLSMKISRREFNRFITYMDLWVREYPNSGLEYRAYDSRVEDPLIYYVMLGEPGLRTCKVLDGKAIDEQVVDENVPAIFAFDDFRWHLYTHLKKRKLL
jgi:hypothetical protein